MTVAVDGVAPQAAAQDVGRAAERPTQRRSRRSWSEMLVPAALALAVFAVHDVRYVLRAPYWVDEAWVAVSTKLPLTQTPHISSSSPLGWTVLLRFVPFGGEQRHRIVPLLFLAAAVAVAWFIGRQLPLRTVALRRVAGAALAVGVLLMPATLIRNDLKQYTADVFVSLLIVLVLLRAESMPDRRRKAVLVLVCVVGFLFSIATAFVTTAAFASLALAALVRRDWRAFLEIGVAGAVAVTGLGLTYLAFYKVHANAELVTYWRDNWLPVDKGLSASWRFIRVKGGSVLDHTGLGPPLASVVLALVGVVTCLRVKRPAVAMFPLLLVTEMLVLGAAKKYPLFDERTSTFLIVVVGLYAVIGIVGLLALVAHIDAHAATALGLAVLLLFVDHNRPSIRLHSIPAEDVRTPTAYLRAHKDASDFVLISGPATDGMTYYWPDERPVWWPTKKNATNFLTGWPGRPEFVYVEGRSRSDIRAAAQRATALLQEHPSARVWLLRTHVSAGEAVEWRLALPAQPLNVSRVMCGLDIITLNPFARSAGGTRGALPADDTVANARC